MNDYSEEFMRRAIEKAEESLLAGGFPAGAVVVKDGKIIGEGISLGHQLNDPTSHGELVAIRNACKNIQNTDLSDAVLYSSMQPCIMCLGAAMWGSVSKIFYACAKEAVPNDYYGGHYKASEINSSFINPLKLIHVPEYQTRSLAIIRAWEEKLRVE